MSFVEFLSDSDYKEQTWTILSLYDRVRSLVLTNESLANIQLVVNVVEFKEYKGMAFLKVKDETGSIAAVIYRSNYHVVLKPNDKIKVAAYMDIYRGEVQLNIRSYQKIVVKEIDNLTVLKKKLAKMGYFDNKPIIKSDYDKIGIISSMNAAGLRDFLSVVMACCCNKKLFIYPSSVQGKDAIDEICNAIELANQHQAVDILVMVRGGGSKEDLECFNSETVAKAIYHSKIPIVTGIGHQIDVSIADLVCAKSYITPTAVAQNITVANVNYNQIAEKLVKEIDSKLLRNLNMKYQYLVYLEEKLVKYRNSLLHEADENLVRHQTCANNYKQKILIVINYRFNYIESKEEELATAMVEYLKYMNNKVKLYYQNYKSGKENLGNLLQIYEEGLVISSRPKILNQTGKEIIFAKDLIKGQEYQLCMIDGVCKIKL